MAASLRTKLILIVIAIAGGWFIVPKLMTTSGSTTYQTETAARQTLVVAVSTSGTVTSGSSAAVTTESSGVVTNVYKKDGDAVTAGEVIAEINLDMEGKQRTAQALSSYQSAKNTLETAKATQYSLQAEMFGQWDEFKELAENSTYEDVNSANRNLPEFHIPQKEWLAAELKYKTQAEVINQAQTAVNSAWLSYQQSSPIIYAPISGTLTGFALQTGAVINAQSDSTITTGQQIAKVKTAAPPTITVNLTEIDVPKITVGNKATVTIDAFADKTFTGTVISVDTVGSISSGVATYPAVIALDTVEPQILANMSASASIITQTKDNVVMIPVSAVKSQNGQSLVQVMRNGTPESVTVETGLASDAQIEIISGITEGDTVVTSTIASSTTTTQAKSVFSSFGGGAMRVGR